ncbi:hypothetical protein QFZ81_003145 [Paenibacillus sp. V4I9]|uniref:hypothetical protein n=1 Tax=Paenibacillus sp. V4I9 TaxID=3042308 RepID=UPI0027829835|nr:hypothetical protein [Paenibacillus sp. V4I9]MDQ0888057.1 hypothetical protein [Paenibacillus sp. V4I9]
MPAWDEMIALLKEQHEYLYNTFKERLEEPVPENFKKTGNFGELMLTAAVHLSNQNGVVAAMLQLLQQKIISKPKTALEI